MIRLRVGGFQTLGLLWKDLKNKGRSAKVACQHMNFTYFSDDRGTFLTKCPFFFRNWQCLNSTDVNWHVWQAPTPISCTHRIYHQGAGLSHPNFHLSNHAFRFWAWFFLFQKTSNIQKSTGLGMHLSWQRACVAFMSPEVTSPHHKTRVWCPMPRTLLL